MATAVPLREDFSAADLRHLARASRDAGQSRRLLALAVIYDGGRRTEAARVGAVGLQTVRDGVLAFNADGPMGLVDGKALGQPAKLSDAQRQALAEAVEQGPDPERDGVVRWRRKDLAAWLHTRFRVSLDDAGRRRLAHRRQPCLSRQHHAAAAAAAAPRPELNPVENVWQFLRDNWLGNRVFTSYDDIVDRCCEAWNRLTDQPWKIMSIGLRDWAHRS